MLLRVVSDADTISSTFVIGGLPTTRRRVCCCNLHQAKGMGRLQLVLGWDAHSDPAVCESDVLHGVQRAQQPSQLQHRASKGCAGLEGS